MTTIFHSKRTNRRGLSLVEILVALTMSLVILGAMMQAFKYANDKITEGRAVIEMASQLRSTEETIRRDLEGLTVDIRPHSDSPPSGVFELIEGPRRDSTDAGNINNYYGDADDVLVMTVSSPDQPFRGRGPTGAIIESPLAYVVYWTSWVDRDNDQAVDYDETTRLYRRVLLIRPDLNDVSTGVIPGATATNFYQNTDIAGYISSAGMVACSLQDLAQREKRPYHDVNNFPHKFNRFLVSNGRVQSGGQPTGEDLLMSDVIGFDLRVFAANAMTAQVANNTVALGPGDPGFAGGTFATGAYVDLNFANVASNGAVDPSDLTGAPALPDGTTIANALRYAYHNDTNADGVSDPPASGLGFSNVYDTWSPHYEVGQQGRDGLDNDGANGVDDPDERVARPPYSVPVRGLKVSIRVIEKNTKQIRQTSVIHSFVPE